MPLTRARRRTFRRIDAKAEAFLDRGGKGALLRGLEPLLVQLKPVLATGMLAEFGQLVDTHPHFAEIVSLMFVLTEGIADGGFEDVVGRGEGYCTGQPHIKSPASCITSLRDYACVMHRITHTRC